LLSKVNHKTFRKSKKKNISIIIQNNEKDKKKTFECNCKGSYFLKKKIIFKFSFKNATMLNFI